jgi:hypothetical protein
MANRREFGAPASFCAHFSSTYADYSIIAFARALCASIKPAKRRSDKLGRLSKMIMPKYPPMWPFSQFSAPSFRHCEPRTGRFVASFCLDQGLVIRANSRGHSTCSTQRSLMRGSRAGLSGSRCPAVDAAVLSALASMWCTEPIFRKSAHLRNQHAAFRELARFVVDRFARD